MDSRSHNSLNLGTKIGVSPGEPEEVKYTETKIAFHKTKQNLVNDQLQKQNQPLLVQRVVTVKQLVGLIKLTKSIQEDCSA